MEVIIKRNSDDGVQTLGDLFVMQETGLKSPLDVQRKSIFSCKTLELPDKGNKPRVSCIPKGTYSIKKGISPSLGSCIKILDVPNRSFILIHSGNFYTQILGCCLVGEFYKDINKDGRMDVANSKNTLKKLMDILPEFCILTIK